MITKHGRLTITCETRVITPPAIAADFGWRDEHNNNSKHHFLL